MASVGGAADPTALTLTLATKLPHLGNLKNAAMTIAGAFAFGDFVFKPWNAAGLAVSMCGAVWYALRSALAKKARMRGSSLVVKGPAIGTAAN